MCIIACNTASTLVLEPLRAAFPDMQFVGTVPAIKPAAERTRSGLVSVLATPGTVRRAYTRDLIQSFAAQCHVRLVGSEYLAGLAEAYIRGDPIKQDLIQTEIEPCFVEQEDRKTDIVVLACTHYPFPRQPVPRSGAVAGRLAGSGRGASPASRIRCWRRSTSCQKSRTLRSSPPVSPDFAVRRLMNGFGLTLAPMRH